MSSYTFHNLSDADLEDLACDLLSEELGLSFQSFTQGRDGGIDLLHGARIANSTIVQCKHYRRSPYSTLRSKLTLEEKPKLSRLNPSRLILATSLPLTPQNKLELLSILSPHCTSMHDIYARDDLNALLRRHPHIEQTHYKLWLTSTSVLQRVLQNGIAVWNAMTESEIEQKLSLYVQTPAYDTAMQILGRYNYCILSGIPGIGKTTLAQVLATRLMEDGHELIAVQDSVQNAFTMLDLTRKQVVYYDDFLGQTSITERLGKNEDHGISRLLHEACRNKNLKVILTTREYILRDAKKTYEPLNRAGLDVAKCTITVEDYTRPLRARILYNHLYFSRLSADYSAEILRNKNYRHIIDHRGYSPRIVHGMTFGAGSIGVPPDRYVEKFLEVLDNPKLLWQSAFNDQLDANARAILYCLGTCDNWIGYEELYAAWCGLCKGVSIGSPLESRHIFHNAMKQLEGSFTRSTKDRHRVAIDFHNPSIKDFVRRRIAEDVHVYKSLVCGSIFFEQVACLACLSATGTVGAGPGGLPVESGVLHDAIHRTFRAKPGTYQMIRYHADDAMMLVPSDGDLGSRLAAIAGWAERAANRELLTLCCDIVDSMLRHGDIERVATASSRAFLTAIFSLPADDERISYIRNEFLIHVERYMEDSQDLLDWKSWSRFVAANKSIFDESRIGWWADRAETFCSEEFRAAIENSETSSQLEEWRDDIVDIASWWGVSFQYDSQEYEELLDQLRLNEEASQPDNHWRQSTAPAALSDDDEDIHRLFSLLVEKARE